MVFKYLLVLIVVIPIAVSLSKPVSNVTTSPSLSADSKKTKKSNFKPGCNDICHLRQLISENRKVKVRENKDDWNRNII